MRIPRFVVVCLCLFAATAVGSGDVLPTAKPEAVGLSPETLGRIVPAVEKLVRNKQVSGAVTVVARRGKVAHFEATGLMDIATKRAMARAIRPNLTPGAPPCRTFYGWRIVAIGSRVISRPCSRTKNCLP